MIDMGPFVARKGFIFRSPSVSDRVKENEKGQAAQRPEAHQAARESGAKKEMEDAE